MTDVLAALGRLSHKADQLASVVKGEQSKLVAPDKVARVGRSMADIYFGSIQPQLENIQHRSGLADEIESVLGAVLQLPTESRRKMAYLAQINELRPLLQEATIDAMKARSVRRLASDSERRIRSTLQKMLPETALSYEQVLQDIATGERVSWRGTGSELREVLREVIDHLAPDADVMAAPNFKLEGDLKRPTQKQKVRFILKARHRDAGVAEASVETVEAGIATLARSAYQRGSATTHTSADVAEIKRWKKYVDALLVELLEIST